MTDSQIAKENLTLLWQFLRGDTPAEHFEKWVYDRSSLEEWLGESLYLELISTKFADWEQVRKLRQSLCSFAEQADNTNCRCIRLANTAVVDMGEHEEEFKTLSEFARRGDPYWWLYASKCSACGQVWLIAQEERHNDVFCFRRLDADTSQAIIEGNWPHDFDQYETLLEIGRDAGRSVDFVEPLNSSLHRTVQDLAKARPGIKISELQSLLNVEKALAEELARIALQKEHLDIVFD